jgi:hypothetical protein
MDALHVCAEALLQQSLTHCIPQLVIKLKRSILERWHYLCALGICEKRYTFEFLNN